MKTNVRRRGFTLPEVLVTITIVAVLAAVVVPAVLNQVNKGDTAGLSGDVDALRSAISNFTTDTRQYPATIHQLTTAITTSDKDIFGAFFSQSAVNAWKGPYFPTSQNVGGATPYSTSAFGLTIKDTLEAPSSATNASFITLVFVAQPTATQVATLNRIFDGGDGTVPAATCSSVPVTATGSTTGNIRWTETDGTPCAITNLKWRLVSAAQ